MGKKLLMMLALIVMSASMAFAQIETVGGTVIDSDTGEPLVGAVVKVDGTTVGTVTDADGKFTLKNLPKTAKMVEVSYMGMNTVKAYIKPHMAITLTPNAQDMSEVMVVAYGSQKKSSFTGAASVMKSEDLEKLQVSSVSRALEGTVAGVQIASSSNTPGSDASIIVRGIGSISSSQSPLIVLDGVPYEGSLNSISSHDIESMTILKDAAANSLYGARGANGVIMITTKAAKQGKAVIDFDAKWGFNTRGVPTYDIVRNPGEYLELTHEAIRNNVLADEGSMAAASQYASDNLIAKLGGYNPYLGVADNMIIDPQTGKLNPQCSTRKWGDDWTKDMFSKSFRQEYNASISGGTENTQAYASLNYLDDGGYAPNSGFTRLGARVKVDQKIGQYVKVGANLGYTKTDMKKTQDREESNYSNVFMFAQNIAPIYPIYNYDANGNRILVDESYYDWGMSRPYGSMQNPLATANENIYKNSRDNFTSRGYLQVNFLKDFTFTTNIAYDIISIYSNKFTTPIGGDAQTTGGRGSQYTDRYGALNFNQILDWNHTFGQNHNVHVMLVHETKSDKERYLYGEKTQFQSYTNPDFSNAVTMETLTSNSKEYALEGYLAKGEYNYAERYYLNASVRRDGSSRFSSDNRWGTFYAVGGAWRVNEEPFFQNVKKTINNLKIKASYGTQGNDNLNMYNSYAYSDLYEVTPLGGGQAGFTKYFRGNKNLTWEKQSMFNVGFELGMWHRLNVNFDFFIKNNNDMLFKSPLPTSEGSPTYIWKNEVDMRNTGFEFEINGDVIKTEKLTWNVALNLSHYKNELTKLPASKPADVYPNGFRRGQYWWGLGKSVYNFAGYEYAGVNPETGAAMYWRHDEDGNRTTKVTFEGYDATGTKIGDPDEVDLKKSAIPDLTGGLSTSLSAYGFDLSIQTAFQIGGYAFDDNYASLLNSGNSQGSNYHKAVFNRWTPTNTNTDIPRLNYGGQNAGISNYSDYFLTNASYFSLRNITLGYTLPKALTKKASLEKVRFYLAADNVWMKSARQGFDPRWSFAGTEGYFNYSAIATYSLGVNLTF